MLANHIGGGSELLASRVGAGSGGVDNGKKIAVGVIGSTVGGDNVPGAGDGSAAISANLRKGASRGGHCC